MMVGTGMKVSISVSLLPIDLVGKGAIEKMRNKNIQKGDRVVFLGFHSELDVRGKAIHMVEERDQVGMAMRPNDKHVIYKLKPTFRFEMKFIHSFYPKNSHYD
jgi:hypothetical protein